MHIFLIKFVSINGFAILMTITFLSFLQQFFLSTLVEIKACCDLDSIVVSIPACHAGDRGSIPRRGDIFFLAAKQSFKISQLVHR